jgi:hypothetical protein
MTRNAQCSCGQLKLEAAGEPVRVAICHCLACQLRTGSVLGVQARFARSDIRTEGRSNRYVRSGDSGQQFTFHFCPDCGSTVFYYGADNPDSIGVPVGAFADPGFPAPRFSVYEARRHPWVQTATPMEHID